MPRSMEKFMGSETTGLQPLASAAVSSTGWQPSATGSAISVNAEAATKRLLQAKRADNDRAAAASLELACGVLLRSEERRVGKEGVSTCRSRWSAVNKKKQKKNKYEKADR